MMKIMKIIKMLGLCSVVFIGIYFYVSTKQRVPLNTLVVGMMSGWPPFMSIDLQGRYVGFDVDIAHAIGKKLGKSVEIKDMGSLSTLFLALQQGKIDLILSGLDITEERRERMNLIPYVGEDITSMCVIFYQQVPQGIKNLEDIAQSAGTIVCVEPNSTSDKLLDLYPSITKKQLKSMADMVLDVRGGKSMAFIAEPAVACRLLKQDPELVCCQVPLPLSLRIYGMGIAVKKENNQLTAAVAKAINDLRREGQLDVLKKQWNVVGE